MEKAYKQIEESLKDFSEADLRLFTRVFLKVREDRPNNQAVGRFFLALYCLLEDQQYRRRENADKLGRDYLLDGAEIEVTWENDEKQGPES